MIAAPVARPPAMIGGPIAALDPLLRNGVVAAIRPLADMDIAIATLLARNGAKSFGQIVGTVAADLAIALGRWCLIDVPALHDRLALDPLDAGRTFGTIDVDRTFGSFGTNGSFGSLRAGFRRPLGFRFVGTIMTRAGESRGGHHGTRHQQGN
jgi:hypothetical protein